VEQILINLIDNACKYAAAGGELTVVAVTAADGGVEVRVGDRGPGVPAEQRERIFEKFHRVDDALTAEKTGAGLGLSIARQLARGLGGELTCAPRVGGGAEFILMLP
jgi:signal transduction histidine kinase